MYLKAILKLSTDAFMHPYNNPCTGERAVCKFCGKPDTEPHEISCVARQFQAMLPGAERELKAYQEFKEAYVVFCMYFLRVDPNVGTTYQSINRAFKEICEVTGIDAINKLEQIKQGTQLDETL